MTDLESQEVDDSKAEESALKTRPHDEAKVESKKGSPLPQEFSGVLSSLGISTFTGPPWANPEILLGLDPETRASTLGDVL